jgi:hypothetical protein
MDQPYSPTTFPTPHTSFLHISVIPVVRAHKIYRLSLRLVEEFEEGKPLLT